REAPRELARPGVPPKADARRAPQVEAPPRGQHAGHEQHLEHPVVDAREGEGTADDGRRAPRHPRARERGHRQNGGDEAEEPERPHSGGVLGVEAHVGDRQVGGEDAPLAAPEVQVEHDRELARPHAPPRPRERPRERPPAPPARRSTVSLVLVSPSTVIAFSVGATASRSVRRAAAAATRASVTTNTRSVAMSGAIMPPPLPSAATVTGRPPRRRRRTAV